MLVDCDGYVGGIGDIYDGGWFYDGVVVFEDVYWSWGWLVGGIVVVYG